MAGCLLLLSSSYLQGMIGHKSSMRDATGAVIHQWLDIPGSVSDLGTSVI